ncbi:UDP-4-amino-4,6-dideoxy-N-acetyl-beta-L-altrosamine transaminase [Shewanella maritima]|uniref:UDP-4-amino-4, 6-dideoxy-N-acetyl-beta-L-altrosamine transaminase n=1 Tax=Shewanella maritima TaxID=2520507 RepID=UPI003735C29B
MIPYGKQNLDQSDINQVLAVLQSDFLTQGPKVPEFEKAMCNYTTASFAVAVNSATSALHIACLSLGINKSSRVWTSPISFVASANCAKLCGAEVDFVDVDPATGNMCAKALENKLIKAKQHNKLPDVIIPVHLAGHPCDMKQIAQLAKEYSFAIIEDASHAIGSEYQGDKVGSCSHSDICVFSFHPVKIITSAEGGMLTTNQPQLAEKLSLLRSHGVTRQLESLIRPNEGDWYYEQHALGLNYRMTDIHAALGASQMTRLDDFVKRRNELAKYYAHSLKSLPLDIVSPLATSYSSRHLFIVKLHDKSKRKKTFEKMREAGIQVHVHYFPIHLQPYYMEQGFKEGDVEQAELFYQQILTLPLFPDLTTEQVDYICQTLSDCLS